MPTAIYPGDDIRSYPMQYYPNGGHQGHQTGPYTTPQYAYPPGMGPNLPYAGGPVGMGNAAGSMVGGGFHPGRAYESWGTTINSLPVVTLPRILGPGGTSLKLNTAGETRGSTGVGSMGSSGASLPFSVVGG